MRAIIFRDTGGFSFLANEEIFGKYKRDFGTEPSQLGDFLPWWALKIDAFVAKLPRNPS
jgi:hypothetical protein